MGLHIGMRVPVDELIGPDIDEFDEANSTLGETPRNDALPGEAFGAATFEPIERESRVGFLR